jgi:c-di-GMP-binding flagellar brake protein YcgR
VTQPRTIDKRRQNELLNEAVRRRTLIQLNCLHRGQWEVFQSRFLGIDLAEQELIIERPEMETGGADDTVSIEPGQNIGVAFRRGHRKHVFSTAVVGTVTLNSKKNKPTEALRLEWPETMQEMQRRLYYRVPIPPKITIPVDVWDAKSNNTTEANAIYRGRLMDVSAGGLSISLPSDADPDWTQNQTLHCRFSPGRGERPLELNSRFRHAEPTDSGDRQIGLQFVGLDTSPNGQEAIRKISRMTQQFRHRQHVTN